MESAVRSVRGFPGLVQDRFRVEAPLRRYSFDELNGGQFDWASDIVRPEAVWKDDDPRDISMADATVFDVWLRVPFRTMTFKELTIDSSLAGYRHTFHDEAIRIAIARPDFQRAIPFTSLADRTSHDGRSYTPLFLMVGGERHLARHERVHFYGTDVGILLIKSRFAAAHR